MDSALVYVIIIVVVALAFDYINGFHDSANAIATVVSTRVLSPRQAVLMAGFFNFVAIFVAGTHVAKTIGTGIISTATVDNHLILAALIGAAIWNIVTWYFGLPSSSSHALVGGLIGSAIAKGGHDVLIWSGIIKTAVFIVLAPMIGLIFGLVMMVIVANAWKNVNATRAGNTFKRLQIVSAAIYSMSHGMNDAQKTMGIIAMVLFSGGYLGDTFYIPIWVMISCYLFIALGTMAGGWRIVKTMGSKITKLRPVDGFCAEIAAAISIIGATVGGIPVSTTHTITGAVIGVGAAKRLTAVRWGVAGGIVWAWVLTIPIAALISAGSYQILTFLGVK